MRVNFIDLVALINRIVWTLWFADITIYTFVSDYQCHVLLIKLVRCCASSGCVLDCLAVVLRFFLSERPQNPWVNKGTDITIKPRDFTHDTGRQKGVVL